MHRVIAIRTSLRHSRRRPWLRSRATRRSPSAAIQIFDQCPEPEVHTPIAASSIANFGFNKGTRIIDYLARACTHKRDVRSWGIVLQKSKVGGLRIFRENTKRESITDSYDLNHVTEVARE